MKQRREVKALKLFGIARKSVEKERQVWTLGNCLVPDAGLVERLALLILLCTPLIDDLDERVAALLVIWEVWRWVWRHLVQSF